MPFKLAALPMDRLTKEGIDGGYLSEFLKISGCRDAKLLIQSDDSGLYRLALRKA